ncbi:MAG: hypothetical protein ABW360_09180 [Phenylobacterium sp.]
MSVRAGDLDWWAANRAAPETDEAELRDLLARLQAWKARHDLDRGRQPGPFLQLAWDAVFGDEDGRVVEAMREIEGALARRAGSAKLGG